jgi:hypothetical protein
VLTNEQGEYPLAVPNFGFTDSAIWVRVKLRNETLHPDHWLLEQGFANMHYVDLYTPLPDGRGYVEKESNWLPTPQIGALRPIMRM